MKIIVNALFFLLLSVASAESSLAKSIEITGPQDLQPLIEALNHDMAELELLTEKLDGTGTMEQEVLLFRRDERGFHLLTDFDNLVSELTALPAGTAQIEEITAQLVNLGAGVGDAVFNRIEDIEQRITQSRETAESLSGGALVAAQAYVQSLESMRIKYYETLVDHLESCKLLGLSTENVRTRLEPNLYLFAEILAGKIELSGASHEEIQTLAGRDPDNADVNAALIEADTRHRVNLVRLEAIIGVFEDVGLDSSEYQAVMLQHSSTLSVNFFSPEALLSVLKDGWVALERAVKDNASNIILKIFLFIIIVYVFRVLSRIAKRIVRAATDRSSLDMSELLKNILVSITGGTIMVVGILTALSQVGLSLTPMIAGLGVAGFIVGFALQDTLGNFAAGAMILIYRPFDVDDFVEVTGASGLVKKMNLVSTTITTFDNQTLVIPNSKIWGDVIKNVTAQTERRVDLEFGIGYDDDIELAERVLNEIVSAHEKVLDDPEPTIKLHTLGDSSVNLIVRPWVKTDDYWDVYWDIMREVKLRFDHEGISIPFPQRDVHLYEEKET